MSVVVELNTCSRSPIQQQYGRRTKQPEAAAAAATTNNNHHRSWSGLDLSLSLFYFSCDNETTKLFYHQIHTLIWHTQHQNQPTNQPTNTQPTKKPPTQLLLPSTSAFFSTFCSFFCTSTFAPLPSTCLLRPCSSSCLLHLRL